MVAGLAGGLALTWPFDVSMLRQLTVGERPDRGLVSGAPLAMMVCCYAPILLWGPLTVAATAGYWWRRSGARLVTSASRRPSEG